ncbi:uncharacterized protein LOC134812895 isoform X2 [Bolinopsis microptera]|uniref:uncharacterized protein LOC134812895 isoform X2 n=1 Tax=Bolinopsis microptera TaxID=2820187 RepID=UPI003078BEF4
MTSVCVGSFLISFLFFFCFKGVSPKERTEKDYILKAYEVKLAKLVENADKMKSVAPHHHAASNFKKNLQEKLNNDETDSKNIELVFPDNPSAGNNFGRLRIETSKILKPSNQSHSDNNITSPTLLESEVHGNKSDASDKTPSNHKKVVLVDIPTLVLVEPSDEASDDKVPIEKASDNIVPIEKESDDIVPIEKESDDKVPIEKPHDGIFPIEKASSDKISDDKALVNNTTNKKTTKEIGDKDVNKDQEFKDINVIEIEKDHLTETKHALMRDVIALSLATIALISALLFIGFTIIKNERNIKSIKKDVRRIATENNCNSDYLTVNAEDSCDSCGAENDIEHKPSLIERIRSSDTVKSISSLKSMNPFTRWTQSKYRSQQMPIEEKNEETSFMVETQPKQNTEIPLLRVEQPSSDEEELLVKAKKEMLNLTTRNNMVPRPETCECIARIVAAVIFVTLALIFVISTVHRYKLEEEIEKEEGKDNQLLSDIAERLSNIDNDIALDDKSKLSILSVIREELSQVHKDIDSELEDESHNSK